MVVNTINEVRSLTQNRIKFVVNNPANWRSFLNCASKMYKYSFTEQVLIHAQKPDAVACTSEELWGKFYGRVINPNSDGIALMDMGGNADLKYIYDISDTVASDGEESPPYIWQLKPEYQDIVKQSLEGEFGGVQNVADGFQPYISRLAGVLAEEHVENEDETHYDPWYKNDWTSLIASSVEYAVLLRCGFSVGGEYNDKFRHVASVRALEDVIGLGETIQVVSKNILSNIEKVVQREHKREQELLKYDIQAINETERLRMEKERGLTEEKSRRVMAYP